MLLNKKENVFHTGCRLSAEERQVFPFRMEKVFFPPPACAVRVENAVGAGVRVGCEEVRL